MNNKKNNLTKFIWLFIIGCIIGYVLEVSWFYMKHGIFINKQGLLYGPFKPIYGLGIIITSFIFSKFKDKNPIFIFILGIFIGTVYEYSLSLFQEYVLHTSTWNYSSFKYNINGRIYLPYCIGWGIFALVWIKFCYLEIEKLILKIPFVITLTAGILMTTNVILSAFAVYEYSNRQNNITTNNIILRAMDKIYPDKVIKKRIPKIKAVKND